LSEFHCPGSSYIVTGRQSINGRRRSGLPGADRDHAVERQCLATMRASVADRDDAVAVAKAAFPSGGSDPAERALRSVSEACAR